MRKIEWKPRGSGKDVTARIGCVVLHCWQYFTHGKTSRRRWVADASIRELSGTFRYGCMRKSLAKAKEDAVRLTRELLLDYKVSLDVEMKNFDLLE